MGELIPFQPSPQFKPKARFTCYHSQIYANQQRRVLECAHCKAVIDPFDYFWDIANKTVKLKSDCKFYYDRKLALIEHVAKLKKEKQYLENWLRKNNQLQKSLV
ncbi:MULTISPECIES: hypothetical protein [Zooshikella]|uniref:hypothetical protein n=1 Tax=Zooshikella TaxID=202771 RepID=UPI0004193EDD|nr:hypothetical protein [Zooshikella ganghwensis]